MAGIIERTVAAGRGGAVASLLGVWILGVGVPPALAGDSLYGAVTEVKDPSRVVLDYGEGRYELRLVGIEVPREGPVAEEAVELLSSMVLGRNARMRFEYRTPEGEMLARLFTDEPDGRIREVAVELVRAGLARRAEAFDFKYGQLAAAEREAREAKRGVWAEPQAR
jgi:endonuclease YncB( thermonuclease family)